MFNQMHSKQQWTSYVGSTSTLAYIQILAHIQNLAQIQISNFGSNSNLMEIRYQSRSNIITTDKFS
jgi:hypothetical protein